MTHPDLPAEQAYLDEAYECLDRMRETLISTAGAAATEEAAQAIEDWANGRLRTFEDAERGLCFGRIDSEEAADPIYVGRRWVHDDDRSALIVNWQTPAARPFYTATPSEPHGLTLRRRFRTKGRELTGISDEALAGSLADTALAEELHALAEQASEGEPRELVVRMEGRFVGLEVDEVAELLAEARTELGFSAPARERFRMNVLRRFYEDYGHRLGGQAYRNFEEVERALRRDGRLTRFLNRTWPVPKPEQVVRRLPVVRGSRAWSEADLPLLDEARALVLGPPQQFGHVIVDEAQDLTPMQLRMVARRASGGFTLLGDIAQATGPIAYDRWEKLLPYLPGGEGAEVAELKHAYRVPREIMAVALPLLERIAPDVEPPLAYRVGAEPPRVVPADPPLQAAYEEAARLAGDEGLLAVIAPASLRGDGGGSLFDETRIPVLTP